MRENLPPLDGPQPDDVYARVRLEGEASTDPATIRRHFEVVLARARHIIDEADPNELIGMLVVLVNKDGVRSNGTRINVTYAGDGQVMFEDVLPNLAEAVMAEFDEHDDLVPPELRP